MALKDKLMTLEDFKAVRDVDVASNSAQFTEIKADLEDLDERLDSVGDGVPTEVRQAMLALFNSAAYAETGLTDEVAVIASWAAVVTAISLNQSSISISGASTSQLVATTTPTGGTVTWVSSDTSVATVSSSGLVTGVGNGSCTITASCGGKNATCSVTVSGFATLTSITATYTQSGTVYNTDSLNSLKSDLVVTANYSDSTTRTLSDSDYTLSGTLEAGTSSITVSYGGKTTTFSVVVVAQEEWGSDYTWLYKASDGQLLSARTDLVTATIESGCSETLENGLLKLSVPQKSDQIIKFYLVQQSNTQGKLTAKVKFNSVGYASIGVGFRLQISNGTNGAQIYERGDVDSSAYTFCVYERSACRDKLAFELNTWHIISVERTGTGQVVSVDGVPIFESASMSKNYCTKNAIFAQNTSTSTVAFDADIAWITYKNND